MVNCPGYDEQQSLGEGGGVRTPDTHTQSHVNCSWLLLLRQQSQQAKGVLVFLKNGT